MMLSQVLSGRSGAQPYERNATCVMPFPATYHASSFRSRRKLSVGVIAPTVVFVTIVRVPG